MLKKSIDKIKIELSETRWWMLPILLVIALPCLLLNKYSDGKWYCNFWGWHKTPTDIEFDGEKQSGICPRCGKNVLCGDDGTWNLKK